MKIIKSNSAEWIASVEAYSCSPNQKTTPHIMEPEGLLPGSCHPNTGRCAKADECSLHVFTIFLLLLLILLLLLLFLFALQSLVNLSFFQNCPPLFSVFYFLLQFLTPYLFRSSSTDSSLFNLGFPTRPLPSDLRTVSFVQRFSSCILKWYPSHHSFLFL
jgi:uncharacterized integral membrane protein